MGMEGMAKKQIFQQHRLIFYSFLKQAKRQESCVDEQYHYTAHLSHTKTYQLIRTELEKENEELSHIIYWNIQKIKNKESNVQISEKLNDLALLERSGADAAAVAEEVAAIGEKE